MPWPSFSFFASFSKILQAFVLSTKTQACLRLPDDGFQSPLPPKFITGFAKGPALVKQL